MGDSPEAKRAALIAQLVQNPKLKLVDPKRPSGETTFLTVDLLLGRAQGQARLEAMPVCEECKDHVIVGREGLIDGKHCAQCAHFLNPPAA